MLGSNKTPDQLQKDSDKIIDVFTSTVNNLSAINSKVDASVKQREEEKAKIEQELSQLNTIKERNNKFMEKINNFLN